ncbi:MAG: hypothetical protein N7Q72_05980, partial [Spiroplasma sp. Tabriz.8]|nr:hypothetical protein [Candidatus Regiella insecticola]MCZ8632794.1 hypothetical protein [Spiroplasma sp. Tabriz.8]
MLFCFGFPFKEGLLVSQVVNNFYYYYYYYYYYSLGLKNMYVFNILETNKTPQNNLGIFIK